MIILPAIDIKDGNCVRLVQGDYGTAHKVAEDYMQTAQGFVTSGAEWIHMVDLDGAKEAKPVNTEIFLDVAKHTPLKVEVGGGIRTMETMELYLSGGVSRVILGSVALKHPELVEEAVKAYGERIAVGIDATVDYISLAREMEKMGVRTIIFTDISKDGTLSGVNTEQLSALHDAVKCNIIASGGVHTIKDIEACKAMGLYGTIAGKSLYQGTLDLAQAITCAKGD